MELTYRTVRRAFDKLMEVEDVKQVDYHGTYYGVSFTIHEGEIGGEILEHPQLLGQLASELRIKKLL